MKTSVLRLWSLGEAAENLQFGQRDLEVTPTERLTSTDGDISSNITTIEADGVDANNVPYSTKVNAAGSIKAKWLSRDAARPYPGLIRRGEQVQIWKVADTDQYYWELTGTDVTYRRGDNYIIACVSDVIGENDHISPLNAYWFEIDSLNGVFRFSSTKANDEKAAYLFRFLMKEAMFDLKDDLGNEFTLLSLDNHWKIKNGNNSFYELIGNDINEECAGTKTTKARSIKQIAQDDITLESTTYDVTASDSVKVETNATEWNSTSSYQVKSTVINLNGGSGVNLNAPNIGLGGALTSTGFGGGAGSASFTGNMSIEGAHTVTGEMTNNGISITGHKHTDSRNGTTTTMF